MDLTVVQPYYNLPEALDKNIGYWKKWDDSFKKKVKIVLVDDGSKTIPLDVSKVNNLEIDVQAYRIKEDIGWNNGGARNLGVMQAQTEFVSLSDLDFIVTNETLKNLLEKDLKVDVSYWPKVLMTHPMKKFPFPIRRPHVNSFVISKALFMLIGGYDNDYAGHYGYEDIQFRTDLDKLGYQEEILPDVQYLWIQEEHYNAPKKMKNLDRNTALYEQKKLKQKDSQMIKFCEWEKIL